LKLPPIYIYLNDYIKNLALTSSQLFGAAISKHSLEGGHQNGARGEA
jgi:hypothetical protein